MTDLCHNCSLCHLPEPCDSKLARCEICSALGHTYNFCPSGVLKKDPKYHYWMLCHNCDEWHLPLPCVFPRHACSTCQNLGHLETFCPVQPNFSNRRRDPQDWPRHSLNIVSGRRAELQMQTAEDIVWLLQRGGGTLSADDIFDAVSDPYKMRALRQRLDQLHLPPLVQGRSRKRAREDHSPEAMLDRLSLSTTSGPGQHSSSPKTDSQGPTIPGPGPVGLGPKPMLPGTDPSLKLNSQVFGYPGTTTFSIRTRCVPASDKTSQCAEVKQLQSICTHNTTTDEDQPMTPESNPE